MWDSVSINIIIKRKYINPYKAKLRSNKVEYIIDYDPYIPTNYAKVPFNMPYFSIINFITKRFHVDNLVGNNGISYDMIIRSDLMVQLGPKSDFG